MGAGKSSIADAVAKALNILHLDTGAMYRAVALAALDKGIPVDDEQALAALCREDGLLVDVRFAEGRQQTLLRGQPVDDRLRSQEIGSAASAVSRFRPVRDYLVRRQQELAARQSMIIDGRDIGAVVLPDARLKIFLTASPEERARRRYLQIRDKEPDVRYEDVLRELIARDRQDTEREVTPLKQAEDAVLLDTTDMDFESSVQAIIRLAEARYGS